MLAGFLSSIWFVALWVGLAVVVLAWPVWATHRKLRAGQRAREAHALTQAQAAMEAWRKNKQCQENA